MWTVRFFHWEVLVKELVEWLYVNKLVRPRSLGYLFIELVFAGILLLVFVVVMLVLAYG